ncbi:MAG: hypothetical protein J3R72DRAFT_431341 [Linnemannia gamsii]|nr:MAG: hypothetical protein J3R72DRAFT_431341 [Linnemannia gamsii]
MKRVIRLLLSCFPSPFRFLVLILSSTSFMFQPPSFSLSSYVQVRIFIFFPWHCSLPTCLSHSSRDSFICH